MSTDTTPQKTTRIPHGKASFYKLVDEVLVSDVDVPLGPVLEKLRGRMDRLVGTGQFHVGTQLHMTTVKNGEAGLETGMIFTSVHPVQNTKHYTLLFERLDLADARALARDMKTNAQEMLRGMDADFGKPDDEFYEADVIANSSFTGVVFIFCDTINATLGDVVNAFKMRGYTAKIYDTARWERYMTSQKPDIFLSHDSRDKEDVARPLYELLVQRGAKVWFDEATLLLGDDLAAKLDDGLRDCNRAVLLLSPNLLANKGWGRTEISTLLNRHANNTEGRVIQPVWVGVTKDEIAERSVILANIVAVDWSLGSAKVADAIIRSLRRV